MMGDLIRESMEDKTQLARVLELGKERKMEVQQVLK